MATAVGGADRAAVERFVREHLLATIVGLCARGDDAALSACGDGAWSVGGEVTVIDEDGRPSYPAYALLAGGAPRVTTRAVCTTPGARVAVATDGFDVALVPEAFGRGAHALRRWMNVRRAAARSATTRRS